MNVKKILAAPNWYWHELPVIRRFFIDFLPFKLFFRRYNTFKIKTDYCFIYSMKRQDYLEHIKNVYKQAPERKKLNYIGIENKLNFSIIPYLLNFKHLKTICIVFRDNSLTKNIFLWLHYIQIMQLKDSLDTWEIKYLIVHADMQPIENMLVQYFNSKKIQTVTLQHGLYIDYSGFDNKNRINYENIVSKYFLAWGTDTKKLIQKYNPHVKIHICGKTDLTRKLENTEESSNYFTIIFDQELFKEYNKSLLEIGNQIALNLNLEMNIRLHPANNHNDYKLDKSHLNLNIYKSKFILGHTSSLMFEIMNYNIPVFKLKSEIPCNHINSSLIFDNAHTLVHSIINNSNFNYKREGKLYIQYLGKHSKEQYKAFFNKLSF